VSHHVLDSFVALNRLLGAGGEAYWLQAPVAANGRTYPAGTLYISGKTSTTAALQRIAVDRGVSFEGTSAGVPAGAWKLTRPRLGLWDQYGGSIDAGWTRWILEQF